MEEQNFEILFLSGQQQKTLSFLEQLFLEQYSHIYLSRMPRAALFSIISFLIPIIERIPLLNTNIQSTTTSLREHQTYLIIIHQMGNNACCEQQAKAGDLVAKSNFNVSKINVQPNNKLSTINFNDPPKSMKLIHQTLKPEVEKKEVLPKESKMKESVSSQKSNKLSKQHKEQAIQKIDQLPILSKKDILRSVQKEQPQKNVSVKLVQTLQNIPEASKQPDEQSYKLEQKPAQQKEIQNNELEQLRKTNLLAPQLNTAVKSTLQTEKIYVKINPAADFKRYDNQFYEGELDTTKKFPNGFGKFYKEDESLYVGEFKMGKAHGQGAYIFSNGSYYQGEFKNNLADGQKGKYKSKELQYEGQFKNNKFHGKGKEKGANHSYQGEYYQGNKTNGMLAWTTGSQKFEYFGTFDANKFDGYGTLKEPNGVYKGQFIKGKKHGNGTYSFNNGLRYQGQYREGQRTGRGVLYNPNNKIAYDGYFQKGLPHGQGSIFDSNGKKMSTKWIEGIDSDLF